MDQQLQQVQEQADRERKLISAAAKAHAKEKATMESEAEAMRRAKARDIEDAKGRAAALRLEREQHEQYIRDTAAEIERHKQDLHAKADALAQAHSQLQHGTNAQEDAARASAAKIQQELDDIAEV